MRLLLLTVVLSIISGCAPPAAPVEEKFVPRPELSAVALTRAALAQLAQGRYLEAELGFRRALYLYPTAENVRRNLAVALLYGGQPEAAEVEYRAIIATAGESAPLMNNLAQAVMAQGRNEDAAAIYESIYARATAQGDLATQVATAINLSTIYFKVGREDDAYCRIEEAFVARPDGETARRYGSLLLALNRPDRARAVVEPILKGQGAEPDPGLLYIRALAAFAQGDSGAIIDSTSRALALGVGDEPGGPIRELRLLQALATPSNIETGEAAPSGAVSRLAEEFGAPTPRWLYLPPQFLRALDAVRTTSAG